MDLEGHKLDQGFSGHSSLSTLGSLDGLRHSDQEYLAVWRRWVARDRQRQLVVGHIGLITIGLDRCGLADELYPGASVIEPSSRAQFWAREIGIQLHEVQVEANAHEISVLFSDLTVEKVAPGYAPLPPSQGDGRLRDIEKTGLSRIARRS
ncbi:MAG: hypothetical protein ACLP62_00190 [Acidimicrobiales bacterium]